MDQFTDFLKPTSKFSYFFDRPNDTYVSTIRRIAKDTKNYRHAFTVSKNNCTLATMGTDDKGTVGLTVSPKNLSWGHVAPQHMSTIVASLCHNNNWENYELKHGIKSNNNKVTFVGSFSNLTPFKFEASVRPNGTDNLVLSYNCKHYMDFANRHEASITHIGSTSGPGSFTSKFDKLNKVINNTSAYIKAIDIDIGAKSSELEGAIVANPHKNLTLGVKLNGLLQENKVHLNNVKYLADVKISDTDTLSVAGNNREITDIGVIHKFSGISLNMGLLLKNTNICGARIGCELDYDA